MISQSGLAQAARRITGPIAPVRALAVAAAAHRLSDGVVLHIVPTDADIYNPRSWKKDALLQPVYWCYRAGANCLLHCFHLGDNPGLGVKDIQSTYGYGGPLSNTDDRQFLQLADTAFGRWALDQAVVAEFLRFHPLIPHDRWYSGSVADNRETVHIDLGGDLLAQYQTRRRTDVRRFLERGLRVERVPAAAMRRDFPGLYRANMHQVGAAPGYYFPENYFDALFDFEGVENWLVYSADQAIAGAVILASARAGTAEYFLGASAKDSGQHKAATGLLHVAAEFYKSSGFRYFYLGGGRSTAADDNLLFFKKGFSPLTGRYRIGSKVHDARRYAELKIRFPDKAATGRMLFYKD